MMVGGLGTRYGYKIGITMGPEDVEEEGTVAAVGQVTGIPGPLAGEAGTLAAVAVDQVAGDPGPVAGEAGTLTVER